MTEIKTAKTDPAVTAGMDYHALTRKMESMVRPKQLNEKNTDLYTHPSQNVDRNKELDPQALVDDLKDFVTRNDISLSFEVDKTTGRTVIKIMDKETDKVLRQLPPEELLELAASLDDLAGHFLNAKA